MRNWWPSGGCSSFIFILYVSFYYTSICRVRGVIFDVSTITTVSIRRYSNNRSITINHLSDGYCSIAPLYQPDIHVRTTNEEVSIILHVPTENEPVYTISLTDGSIIQEEEANIRPISSTPDITKDLPPWIKHHAPATLYLPDIKTPKQGYLLNTEVGHWEFLPGKQKERSTNKPIPILNFVSSCKEMLSDGHLSRGHIGFQKLLKRHPMINVKQSIIRHVSDHGISTLTIPTLSNHAKLPSPDQTIWNEAYAEEYDGLQRLDTWGILTQVQYIELRH